DIFLVRPREDDYGIRLLDERPAVEAAADFPAGEAGHPQQQRHLRLVDVARTELGPVNGLDGPVGADHFDLVYGALDLLDAVEGAGVVQAQQRPGPRVAHLPLEHARVLGRADDPQPWEE